MEVEVKLGLLNALIYARLNPLPSSFHLKTLHQQNLFFDSDAATLSSQRAVTMTRVVFSPSRPSQF
ncbi:hypothetical protein MANES_06G044501v8 [Manihot esculenta]|uniref:CYTH domain-containing protein n=1 Tax=Manihot esculenta TaxID=3983 RepID=A0A2C9VMW1_MANES|nr:hypothetical protein MANES_06G044501v8 [Manihot esculenta]